MESRHYLNSEDCSGEDFYVVDTYDPRNNTIVCNKENCEKYYGSYDGVSGDCDDDAMNSADPNYWSQYSEVPRAFGECVKIYNDPDSSAKDYSFNKNLTAMYTCLVRFCPLSLSSLFLTHPYDIGPVP